MTKGQRKGEGRYWPKYFWANTRRIEGTGCWEWLGACSRYGYGIVNYPTHQVVHASRRAWEISHGVIPPGLFVLHRCDNRRCVRPSHLFVGTHTDNMRDMVQKGRNKYRQGEASHLSKLSKDDIEEIRRVYALGGTTYRKLARRYGVTHGNIGHILCRRSWKAVLPC